MFLFFRVVRGLSLLLARDGLVPRGASFIPEKRLVVCYVKMARTCVVVASSHHPLIKAMVRVEASIADRGTRLAKNREAGWGGRERGGGRESGREREKRRERRKERERKNERE